MPREYQESPIQKMLDENAFLIRTISDFQNVGRNEETLHHQSMLQKSLMYIFDRVSSRDLEYSRFPIEKKYLCMYEIIGI